MQTHCEGKKKAGDPKQWTVEEVASWMESEGLEKDVRETFIVAGQKRGAGDSFPNGGRGKQPHIDLTPDEAFAKYILTRWTDFWGNVWGRGLDHFRTQFIETRRVQCDEAEVDFEVMKIHNAFQLEVNGLLVRDEWKLIWDRAQQKHKSGKNNFILVGHPGTGKTLSLYYFLAMRLAHGLPTFFQTTPAAVLYFNAKGVRSLSSAMNWETIPGVSRENRHWALVDSNRDVTDPASLLYNNASPFFILEAAAPHEHRWHWTKYHGNTSVFYTEPFSLTEIFQGNSLQPRPANHDALRDFFINYGPSTRDCYNATAGEQALESYLEKLNRAVAKMSWDDIDRFVVSVPYQDSKMDEDTPFLLVLVSPADEDRIRPHASVMTHSILRLLWMAHGLNLRRKVKEYVNPKSRASAGWVFESIVHDQLEAGINVPVDPMQLTENNRAEAVYDMYTTSPIGKERWQSDPMTYVPFTQNDRTLKPLPNHFYVPVDGTPGHPTYDSFTFQYIVCSSYKGPILDSDGTILRKNKLDKNSNVGLFTVFQVTEGLEHDMNEKVLTYILLIAKQLELKAIAIRYIGIVPAGEERIFKAPIAWRRKLDTYSLPIALYEPT